MLFVALFVTVLAVLPGVPCFAASTNGRVINGEKAETGEFPMYVQVWYASADINNGIPEVLCGGSIISKRVILTAAYCISNDPNSVKGTFKVLAGISDFQDSSQRGVLHGVTKAVMHKDFGKSKYGTKFRKYDIALLFLDTDLKFGKSIKPVRLSDSQFDEYAYNSDKCFLAGFGTIIDPFNGTQPIPMALQKANIDVVRNKVCNRVYDDFAHPIYRKLQRLTPDRLCTATKDGSGACQRDEGGPMGCYDNKGRFRLVGVISTGISPSCMLSINTFTRVSYYRGWIDRMMDKHL